jgi:glutathione S-transferase
MLKLFYSPGACSLSPHIALEEAGLKYQAVRADLKSKTTESGDDFKKTNPLGYVPALVLEDGTVLTEGPAIVQYIADKAPTKNLAPAAGSLERYKLQSWLNFVSTEMHKGYSPMFNPAMPEEAKKIARDRLATRLQHLDQHLAKNEYLLGKTYSVVDGYLFTVLNWSKTAGVDLTPFANVQAYQKRIASRSAVQAAMKAEGLIK